jgi:hypothetical protein
MIACPVADADLAEVIARRGSVDRANGGKTDDHQCKDLGDARHQTPFATSFLFGRIRFIDLPSTRAAFHPVLRNNRRGRQNR